MAWQKAQLALAGALLLTSAGSGAMDVSRLNVSLGGERYIVEFKAHLDAPPAAVGDVLTDFAHYPTLDPRIKESRMLPAGDQQPARLYTRLRGCLGALLCRTMRRIEVIEQHPGELVATAIAGESDVSYGVTRSRWQAGNGGTDVTYRLEITPAFWVPPLIGRRLMVNTLRQGTHDLFTNVEKAAQERAQQMASASP